MSYSSKISAKMFFVYFGRVSSHPNQVALNLSKCNGIIYKLHNYVNRKTLLMLCYNLGYSHVLHGITLWGTAAKSLLHRIQVEQNNILRTISWSKKYCHVTELHKNFELSKLQDISNFKLKKAHIQNS